MKDRRRAGCINFREILDLNTKLGEEGTGIGQTCYSQST